MEEAIKRDTFIKMSEERRQKSKAEQRKKRWQEMKEKIKKAKVADLALNLTSQNKTQKARKKSAPQAGKKPAKATKVKAKKGASKAAVCDQVAARRSSRNKNKTGN